MRGKALEEQQSRDEQEYRTGVDAVREALDEARDALDTAGNALDAIEAEAQ